MPHQCTNCDRTFDDGSKEMLSGCPNCGGNKFQFKPAGAETADSSAEPPEPPEPSGSSVAQTVGKTAATVKDLVGGSSDERSRASGSRSNPEQSDTGSGVGVETDRSTPMPEDTAQASARTDVVTADELPSEPVDDDHHFRPVSESTTEGTPTGADEAAAAEMDVDTAPTTDTAAPTASPDQSAEQRPGLEELRAELNDQFESIKVLAPGQYELNLMELYDREEYIIALEEDGRYSIQVPENFRK